jgi:GNAT superfamily N-acetyltransferase
MSVTIRPAQLPAEYPRIAELLNSALAKPVTPNELAQEDAGMPPGSIKVQFVAVDEAGRPIGYAEAHRFPNTKIGKFYVYTVVDPAARGRGIGAALLAQIEQVAIAHGGNYFLGEVRDDDPISRAFAERRGYKLQRHGYYSTLDLTTWDGARFAGVIDRVQASGIRLFTLDQAAGAEAKLYELMSRTMVDIPGYEGTSFMSVETWHNFLIGPAGHQRVIIAADGDRFVGVTMLHPAEAGTFYTPHTSVDRAYRGRSIALALKLAAIELALKESATKLTTGNDSNNVGMLAINNKLGYVPSAGSYDMAKYL